MKQAANPKDVRLRMLPGTTINTGAKATFPIEQLQLMQLDGAAYRRMNGLLTGEAGMSNDCGARRSSARRT
jgi:hypothetical protein